MKGQAYRNTFAAKGSALHTALAERDRKAAERLYNDTTARFDALHPAGDRQWFEQWGKDTACAPST